MQCKPFHSAASDIVPESGHPLEQLKLLDEKAQDLGKNGDIDAVIECRIKQLALRKVLAHLYAFPLKDYVLAQTALAEDYASGGYCKQARDHLDRARDCVSTGIHDDGESQRLHIDLLIAEGAIRFAEDQLDQAEHALTDALRLGRTVFGEFTKRTARVHSLMGQIAQRRRRFAAAAEHLMAAWEVHESMDGPEGEDTMRLKLQIASALYADGKHQNALDEQRKVVETLQRSKALPELLVDALSQLARWLEDQGSDSDGDALEALKSAEVIVEEVLGKEDPKAVGIKRDVALLHLKLGNHEMAMQYLQNVEYLERRLHGSQSANVARTLKALGTVHLVRGNSTDAEQCLLQALHIFEADYPPNTAIVRDIRSKLSGISNNSMH